MVETDPNETTEPEASSIGYTVGTWAGNPNYLCEFCPYDTLEEDQILLHLATRHTEPLVAPVVPDAPKLDVYGNVVEIDETTSQAPDGETEPEAEPDDEPGED